MCVCVCWRLCLCVREVERGVRLSLLGVPSQLAGNPGIARSSVSVSPQHRVDSPVVVGERMQPFLCLSHKRNQRGSNPVSRHQTTHQAKASFQFSTSMNWTEKLFAYRK